MVFGVLDYILRHIFGNVEGGIFHFRSRYITNIMLIIMIAARNEGRVFQPSKIVRVLYSSIIEVFYFTCRSGLFQVDIAYHLTECGKSTSCLGLIVFFLSHIPTAFRTLY